MQHHHTRQVPALRARVARSAALARVLAAMAAAGLAGVLAWLALGAGAVRPAVWGAALLLCCACAGAAWRTWRAMPQGWLVQQHGVWWFEPEAAPAAVQPLQCPALHLDAQRALLLSARGAQGRCWLWLERCQNAPQWTLLRAVLLAQCKSGAQPTIDPTPPAQGGL